MLLWSRKTFQMLQWCTKSSPWALGHPLLSFGTKIEAILSPPLPTKRIYNLTCANPILYIGCLFRGGLVLKSKFLRKNLETLFSVICLSGLFSKRFIRRVWLSAENPCLQYFSSIETLRVKKKKKSSEDEDRCWCWSPIVPQTSAWGKVTHNSSFKHQHQRWPICRRFLKSHPQVKTATRKEKKETNVISPQTSTSPQEPWLIKHYRVFLHICSSRSH